MNRSNSENVGPAPVSPRTKRERKIRKLRMESNQGTELPFRRALTSFQADTQSVLQHANDHVAPASAHEAMRRRRCFLDVFEVIPSGVTVQSAEAKVVRAGGAEFGAQVDRSPVSTALLASMKTRPSRTMDHTDRK